MAVSEFLRDVIAELKGSGARRARAEFDGPQLKALEIEFSPYAEPAGFTDATGKPVNLDEGMPALAKDPDDEAPALDASDAALERANFRPKRNGKAA